MEQPLRRRGIVLPVCLSLMFTMFILALALAQQARVHLGFALLVEAETRQREAGLAALADLESILQFTADPAAFSGDMNPSYMSLPNPLPSPGGATVPFSNGADIDVRIAGEFNGSMQDASIYRGLPTTYNQSSADGYDTPLYTNNSVAVPLRHAAVYVQAAVPNEPLETYLGVFTSNYPFGVMSLQGTVTLSEARSVFAYPGLDSNESGVMANIYGAKGVTITPGLSNARVYGPNPLVTGTRGIGAAVTISAMPADFENALVTAKGQVSQGLLNKGADVQSLHDCLHQNIPDNNDITATCTRGTPVSQFNPGSPDIATIRGVSGTDLNANVFQVASTDFVVPSKRYLQIPYSMDIQGNLVLMQDSVLSVTGTLAVHGHVYMGLQTSLVVGSTLTVDNTVDMLYKPSPNVSISSSILVSGDATLSGGMSSHEQGGTISSQNPFSKPDCPFPLSTLTCMIPGRPPQIVIEQVQNPNCQKFDQISSGCVAANNAAWVAFFETITPTGPLSVDNVAGIFVNCAGTLTVGGQKAAGLFVADSNIDMNATRMIGAMWSRSGSINAPATKYRYFPYWTYASVHSAARDVGVAATRFWRVGYGRLQQYWTVP